jgi:hypothetical protein
MFFPETTFSRTSCPARLDPFPAGVLYLLYITLFTSLQAEVKREDVIAWDHGRFYGKASSLCTATAKENARKGSPRKSRLLALATLNWLTPMGCRVTQPPMLTKEP